MPARRRWRYGLILVGAVLGGAVLLGAVLAATATTKPRHDSAQSADRVHSTRTKSTVAHRAAKARKLITPKHKRALFSPCNVPTPCNQDALDRVLESAIKIAGSRYYTDGAIDTEANTATVYLVADTPQSIIDEIQAKYPNVQVFHSAAHSKAALAKLLASMPDLRPLGIDVREIATTSDGYLEIGVAPKDVKIATSKLEAMFGADWVRVVADDGVIVPLDLHFG